MPSEKQEHVAIVTTTIAVFTKSKSGELYGPVMNQQEMSEIDLPHISRVSINGFDKFECIKKTKGAIQSLKESS